MGETVVSAWPHLPPGQVVKTNQFSVTKHQKISRAQHGDTGLPGEG